MVCFYKKITVLFILLFPIMGFSQEENLSFNCGYDLAGMIEIKYLPENESFATIQIFTTASRYTYNSNFFSQFILIKPIFVYKDSVTSNVRRYSIGIYKTVEQAEQHLETIQCLFPDAYVVCYQNGKRIQKENYLKGGAAEIKINIKDAKKHCKKILKDSYWRLQFGYYEQDSLNSEEKIIYDSLVKNNFKIIQEKYEKGRLYLSEKKYKTFEEVQKARSGAEAIIGRDVIAKPYYDFPEIELELIEKIYRCLTK